MVCATSKTEHDRNGGEQISAEQDDKYERLRRVVGYCLAHKAWWHNKGAITIYASADFPSSSDVLLGRESNLFEQ